MNIRRFLKFLAADDGTTIPTTAAEVPVVQHSVDTTPVEVHIDADPGIEKAAGTKAISAASELGLNLPKGIKGPKELGITEEDPDTTLEAINIKLRGGQKALNERERDENGRFMPKKESAVEQPKPKAKPAAKAPATKPTPQKPAAPALAAPIEPPKIKIGNEEKTAEEWAKELEALKSGKPPEEKKEPATEQPATEKTDEQLATEEKEQDDAFIADFVNRMPFKPEEIDDFLATGDPKKFANLLARVALDNRKHYARETNRVVEEIWKQVDRVTAREDRISQYEQEQTFLNQYPEIKAHEQGAAEAREVRKLLHEGYDAIQQRIATNTATPQDRAWAANYEAHSPEDFDKTVAAHVRDRLKIAGALPLQETQPKAGEQPAAKKEAPRPKPFNGERPGGAGSSGGALTTDQRIARELFG